MTENTKNPAQITSKVYELLKDLESEERSRIISATLALFGESTPNAPNPGDDGTGGNGSLSNVGKKAALWMRQNSISDDQLLEVFHFDESGAVEIIAADVPGANKKIKAGNAYLICGIRSLFQKDEARVDNQQAVELCQHMGCYDKNNHTANRKALGNKLSGSVKDGFLLPAPGLKAAADLIRNFS